MWGTERDYKLLKKLLNYSQLKEVLKLKKWKKGNGFQTSKPKDDENHDIQKIPHIEAKKLERYYTTKENTIRINTVNFERLGALHAYKSPHLLIKEGQKKKRFCSSFIDYDCSFRKTIYGIHSNDVDSLKNLSAFLNSSLAFYIMFLSTGDWGVERERVLSKEILDIPALCFELTEKYKKKIVTAFDQIIELKNTNQLNEAQLIADLEQKIETALWDALQLSKTERILIEDVLTYSLDALPAWATIFNINARIPLNITVLHLSENNKADTIIELPEKVIGQLLKEMEQHTYEEYAESIYFRKFYRYYNGETIYIIKPNEKRFWSRSMAINDADELIVEILNQMK